MEWVWEQSISKEIFEMKYMLQGEKDIDEVFSLIAEEVSFCEDKKVRDRYRKEFYDVMSNGYFCPAGRVLANARPNSKMKNYNNCFVIAIEDSMESITTAIKEYMTILQKGGGVGINISALRPKGATISTGGESSGVMSFLEIFNTASETIKVGGGRRGASLCALNVDHPDIEEFITYKQGDKNGKLKNFNISVGISDAFMKAYEQDKDWDLIFEGKIYKTVRAKYLYDLLTKNAMEYAEPGTLFLDTVNRYNNLYNDFTISSTNPCGEQILEAYTDNKGNKFYGSCNLGSVNLSKLVLNPFTEKAEIDWDNFKRAIEIGVRFLDNVIDSMEAPLKPISNAMYRSRRVGLGYKGFANCLAMLRMKYGSKESLKIADQLGSFFRDTAYDYSIHLSKEKGCFPALDKKKYLDGGFVKNLPEEIKHKIKKYGIRNAFLLSIAPSGTISFSVGNNCSSGIEPIFALQYKRNIRTGEGEEIKQETVYDYGYLQYLKYLKENGFEFTDIPEYFTVAHDVSPKEKIDMISIWQKYIDTAISNTTNIKKEFSYEEFKDLYYYAYEKGLKGFTTFWEGGHLKGILSTEDFEKENKTITRSDAPERPKELECDIHEITVQSEKYIILVGKLGDGSLYEIFVTNNSSGKLNMEKHKTGNICKIGKNKYNLIVKNGEDKTIIEDIGTTFNDMLGTLARFVSMSLRHGTPLEFVVRQLSKDNNFLGFERSVSRVLKKYIKEGEKVTSSEVCPECQNSLIFKEGCISCESCGWSKCS